MQLEYVQCHSVNGEFYYFYLFTYLFVECCRMMNWEGCARKWSWLNFKLLTRHLPGGTIENHKNLSQNRRFPGRDYNPGPQKEESSV
jgi:hypothetical protein